MRTLSEITAAVRQAEPVTEEELRYAVVAYDVMVAQMELPNDPARLYHYFQAADNDPRAYIGEANDPAFAGAREWYRAMHGAGEEKRTLDGFKTCEACEGVGLYNAGLGQTLNCNTCKGSGLVRSS